eukprot:COSAG02_NODE_16_length_56207_cov_9.816122_24_plen_148_part_00
MPQILLPPCHAPAAARNSVYLLTCLPAYRPTYLPTYPHEGAIDRSIGVLCLPAWRRRQFGELVTPCRRLPAALCQMRHSMVAPKLASRVVHQPRCTTGVAIALSKRVRARSKRRLEAIAKLSWMAAVRRKQEANKRFSFQFEPQPLP